MDNELKTLPLSSELLDYYRHKLDSLENDYQLILEQVNGLRVSHEETHKITWELHKRSKEVTELQQAISDFQIALFDERKHLLRVVSENDQLKVQELKDRNKIRYLLALSGATEEEVTYFRDKLDKRLVKIPSADFSKTTSDRKAYEDRDIIILEDEIQGLLLKISAFETQLDEQKSAYETTIAGLMRDRAKQTENDKIRRDHDIEKIEKLQEKLGTLRGLCRENTKELLRSKKSSSHHERKLVEERAGMIQEINSLKSQLRDERERNEAAEMNIEKKINRKQEGLVSELRGIITKYEHELRETKKNSDEMEKAYQKKVDYFKTRVESMSSNYNALKKRRDYEIEGFTNDILILRKQLKVLEKNILKYGPLEDKELQLLNLARATGEKADKISSELQNLKSKVYATEKKVQELEF